MTLINKGGQIHLDFCVGCDFEGMGLRVSLRSDFCEILAQNGEETLREERTEK